MIDTNNTSESPIPRDERARTAEQLKRWIREYTGLDIPDRSVCDGHHSPWDCFQAIHLERPSIALVLGSRGSGKSFLSALDTHLTSRWDPNHGTRILGGSKQQSAQIYEALRAIATDHSGPMGDDADSIAKLWKDRALYANGSKVEILAASSTSVRGPHVPSLKLDEVDEMDTDIRESAMGMCLGRIARRGDPRGAVNASVVMTSTCHKINGPMAKLIERAQRGDFPLFTMCAFEVLERCPESRSGPLDTESGPGPRYKHCPACPLQRYCYDVTEGDEPKAKRSDGYYPIESLIQKFKTTGRRVFEADYLCKLSSGDAAWFPKFQPETHVSDDAEYRPGVDVHLAIDTGVFTGAVFFQVIPTGSDKEMDAQIHVFADYLAEGDGAEHNAHKIRKMADARCQGAKLRMSTDPAGKARTAIGPTVLAEYVRAGLELKPWPLSKVSDSLALLDSFITPADGNPRLFVHPRCQDTIDALQCYRRAKRGGQWLDVPADPQHPYEDLVDALRGGLKARFPHGRTPEQPALNRVKASKVF